MSLRTVGEALTLAYGGEFPQVRAVEVVSVSGEDGVLVNTLESNAGMIQVFAFPLPFSYIIS